MGCGCFQTRELPMPENNDTAPMSLHPKGGGRYLFFSSIAKSIDASPIF